MRPFDMQEAIRGVIAEIPGIARAGPRLRRFSRECSAIIRQHSKSAVLAGDHRARSTDVPKRSCMSRRPRLRHHRHQPDRDHRCAVLHRVQRSWCARLPPALRPPANRVPPPPICYGDSWSRPENSGLSTLRGNAHPAHRRRRRRARGDRCCRVRRRATQRSGSAL